jgi:hypothetical protein
MKLLKLNPIPTILLACCVLSTLEFSTLLIARWFGEGYIDADLLSVVYGMVAPILLFYLLPLQTFFRLGISKGKSILLYFLAIALLSIMRPFFLQFFPDAVSLPRSGSAICLAASESLEFGLRASCIGHVFLSLLLINTILWAAPLSLLEAALVLYARFLGSRSTRPPD